MGELAVAQLLSVRLRLILLLLIPSLMYVFTSVYMLQMNHSTAESLTSSLYETSDRSTSLILNADRDMYQALTAYQLLVSGTLNAEEKAAQLKALQENIEQTNTRVGQAVAILKEKQLLQTAHAETNTTIKQNAADFQVSFDQWVKGATSVVQSGAVGKGVVNDPKLMDVFEKGRAPLNRIGEILDADAHRSITDVEAKNRQSARGVYIGVAIVLISLLLLGGIVIRKIMQTVRRILDVTGKIAAGDLCIQPQQTYARDEFGKIAQAIDLMLNNMKSLIGTIAQHTQYVHDASNDLSDSSKESARAAEHVALNIQEMAQEVEVQARSSEETSRAIEEMAIGIQRVAENASIMSDHSTHTSEHAGLGHTMLVKLQEQIVHMLNAVEQLSGTVQSLTRKSDQIGEIASSITSFANQTNILSLNASIEAARAGEHGKGFSVVANEIRKLASQSLASADTINQLIDETRVEIASVSTSMAQTRQEASEGSRLMAEVNQSFDTIHSSVTQIVTQIHETSAITQQMSASSEEISATMDHAAASSSQMMTKSQAVAAATEEQLAMMENIAAASEQLRTVVDALTGAVAVFKIK
ncbi:methyl-accepting chemotaxis protein [Paenibacillus whitsoniae]|uniref:Methyl-accepting chemotaxis protein n=1 Tax=Paenibacillus whitsoniae TaxID=2496558 RepID=A0A430JB39_9BACL|nr:methyl-accepting chemotaxis protein [Paenibacillus whitsoniae]